MSNDTRLTLEDLEIQRFFFAPSFEIYNGVAGLYDLGPVGCAIERNLLAKWRDHFVIEEDMCEVRCSMLTPYKVLESSGHTAKFSDFMVSDTVTKQLYRADQLIESELEKRIEACKDPAVRAEMEHDQASAGDLQADGIQALIEKWKIQSPAKHPLTQPVPFNLMFNTMIGPGERAIPGFLRPETAQGIFVNFPRLYEFQKQLPFACAQQGVAYRNEIAPRNGLVRCREFMMAEIEHFADPEKLNDFPKFDNVKDLEIGFLSAARQENEGATEAVKMTIGKAVEDGIVCHKTMGYYIGRTYLFMTSVGINPEKLRFRQHRSNEKAHYARDCWDAEIKVAMGWLECAGIADRQSFDLTQHSKATAKSGEELNTAMTVQVMLDEPIKKTVVTMTPNASVIGKTFKAQAKAIVAAMAAIPEDAAEEILAKYTEAEAMIGGTPKKGQEQAAVDKLSPEDKAKFESLTTLTLAGNEIKYGMYTISKKQVTVYHRSVIPNVIEPSFGVGRIITCLLEHAFYIRQDREERRVLGLKPCVAPYKVAVLPLSAKAVPEALIHDVRTALRKAVVAHRVDASGVSIGKRYARNDELGIAFAITLDKTTVENGTVTLRERDSTKQVRLTIPEAVAAVVALSNETETWESIASKYEPVEAPQEE